MPLPASPANCVCRPRCRCDPPILGPRTCPVPWRMTSDAGSPITSILDNERPHRHHAAATFGTEWALSLANGIDLNLWLQATENGLQREWQNCGGQSHEP